MKLSKNLSYSKSSLNPIIFCFLLSVLFTVAQKEVIAQSKVEQATFESDRLDAEQIKKELSRPPKDVVDQELQKFEDENDQQKFFIKKIHLIGTQKFTPESFQEIVSQYENKDLTITSLQRLARQIEQEYLRRGIMAACIIPPQDIKNEEATLQVVETKMGDLIISDHKWFNKKRLHRYWKIPKGEHIDYYRLRESLLRMNKNADREVTSSLQAGKEPQTTDVVLNVKTHLPIHLVGSIDNEGISSTGKLRNSIGGRHNNFLGFDDTLFAGYSFGKNFGGYYIFHNLPINGLGTSLFYGFSHSWAVPQQDFSGTGLKSISKNGSLMIRQDIYQQGDYLGEVFLGFDIKNKGVNQHTGTVTNDRLRILSAGGNFYIRGENRITVLSPKFSQGINAFGATDRNNPTASRNASTVFSIINFNMLHRRKLPYDLIGNFRLQSQMATTRLMSQETLSLGGIDSVRGYPSGDFLADHALVMNGELLIPPYFVPKDLKLPILDQRIRDAFQFVAFTDYGFGHRFGEVINEKENVSYFSVGGGVRVNLKDKVSLRFEWGFPLGNDPISEGENSRFHFSIDFQI